jgi:hypothetical protein
MSSNDDFKKQFENIQNQLTQIRKEILQNRTDITETTMRVLESGMRVNRIRIDEIRSSVSALYDADISLNYSIVMSAVIGVLGNLFVSYLFQPRTPEVVGSLYLTGLFLVATLSTFVWSLISAHRKRNKALKELDRQLKEQDSAQKRDSSASQ